MQQISPLFNSLLKHNRAGLSTEDFFRQLTITHPYFIPAQFYLLQQINEEHSTYNEQAAKTALFFNNPYWLNFQLQYTKPANIINEAIENADNDDDATTEMQIPEPKKLIITESTGSIAPPIISENLKLSPEELMLAENADNDDDEAIVEEEIAPKSCWNLPKAEDSEKICTTV